MIKKILKFLGIFLIVVLALLFTLPFLFKDTIIEKVKEEANNNLNAKVDFGEFDLSIISSFPDFNFSINDVKVSGIDNAAASSCVKANGVMHRTEANWSDPQKKRPTE